MLKIKLQNFKKLLKQKRCGKIHLNVPNLLQFYEKIHFRVKKMQITVKTMHLSSKCNKYEFLNFFHLRIDFFVKMKQVWNSQIYHAASFLFQTILKFSS